MSPSRHPNPARKPAATAAGAGADSLDHHRLVADLYRALDPVDGNTVGGAALAVRHVDPAGDVRGEAFLAVPVEDLRALLARHVDPPDPTPGWTRAGRRYSVGVGAAPDIRDAVHHLLEPAVSATVTALALAAQAEVGFEVDRHETVAALADLHTQGLVAPYLPGNLTGQEIAYRLRSTPDRPRPHIGLHPLLQILLLEAVFDAGRWGLTDVEADAWVRRNFNVAYRITPVIVQIAFGALARQNLVTATMSGAALAGEVLDDVAAVAVEGYAADDMRYYRATLAPPEGADYDREADQLVLAALRHAGGTIASRDALYDALVMGYAEMFPVEILQSVLMRLAGRSKVLLHTDGSVEALAVNRTIPDGP